MDHVHDEITLLSNMKHPFIVNFDGFTQDESYLYLVMEFVQGGEFFIYLRSVGKLKPLDAAYFFDLDSTPPRSLQFSNTCTE